MGFQLPTKDSRSNPPPEGFEPLTKDFRSNPLTNCTKLGPRDVGRRDRGRDPPEGSPPQQRRDDLPQEYPAAVAREERRCDEIAPLCRKDGQREFRQQILG